jgi:hypothetical protein
MVLHALLAGHLVILAATGPIGDDPTRMASRPVTEKAAVVQTLVNRATDCIAQAVAEKSGGVPQDQQLGDLIVAVMPACADRMRAMIDGMDRNFGDGSGEAFFSGSYLDLLPRAVSRRFAK